MNCATRLRDYIGAVKPLQAVREEATKMAVFKSLKWKIILFYTYIRYARSITPQSLVGLALVQQFEASHQGKQSLLKLSNYFISH